MLEGTIQHCEEGGERYTGSKADILSHRVEEPDEINESPHAGPNWIDIAYHI